MGFHGTVGDSAVNTEECASAVKAAATGGIRLATPNAPYGRADRWTLSPMDRADRIEDEKFPGFLHEKRESAPCTAVPSVFDV